MEEIMPRIIENREFVDLEEEDIQRLNLEEISKFERNQNIGGIMKSLENELGSNGHWEAHWLTLNSGGSRVYAKIYYGEDRALALTSDGRIIRELNYPPDTPVM